MLNCLVTGAAGFIGSNLVRRLLKNDCSVYGIDNLSSGNIQNLADLLDKSKNFAFDIATIENLYTPRGPCHKYDYIINLACPASPVAYQNMPFDTISASTIGVDRLVQESLRHDARFLHTSTSEVYGDPTQHPQTEEYFGNVNCYGPRACYDESKRLAETIIWEYQRRHPNFVGRIVRIFNTYGPYMSPDDGRVVSNFIVQSLKNEPITIYGDGSQTRSFCYIDDLLDVLLLVLEGPYHKPLNIGNPGEFTMLELADVIKGVTGSKSPIIFKPLPGDDPKQRRPDISKVSSMYGWKPKVSLEEGIEKTATYFESVLKG
jgi:UDP-glucuronate decarboxylase